jgi:hypothetical protein
MNELKLYKDLDEEIQQNIKKTEEFYKNLNTTKIPIANLEDYKFDLGTDIKEYQNKLWNYFNTRYNDQTKIKKYYFELEQKLLEKKAILEEQTNDLQDEYETNKNKNQLAISSIKNDKYQLQVIKANNRNMFIIACGLIAFIIVMCLSILGSFSINFVFFISLIILSVCVIIIGYYWYNDRNRSNIIWEQKDYNVSKDDNIGGSCNSNLGIVNDSLNKEKEHIDKKIKQMIN